MTTSRWMTPECVQSELHIPKATLATWRVRGGGPPYTKAGARVLYDRADVLAWLEAAKRRTTAGPARSTEAA